MPIFTTTQAVELGFINLSNGNLHIEIRTNRFCTADVAPGPPIPAWSTINHTMKIAMILKNKSTTVFSGRLPMVLVTTSRFRPASTIVLPILHQTLPAAQTMVAGIS